MAVQEKSFGRYLMISLISCKASGHKKVCIRLQLSICMRTREKEMCEIDRNLKLVIVER